MQEASREKQPVTNFPPFPSFQTSCANSDYLSCREERLINITSDVFAPLYHVLMQAPHDPIIPSSHHVSSRRIRATCTYYPVFRSSYPQR